VDLVEMVASKLSVVQSDCWTLETAVWMEMLASRLSVASVATAASRLLVVSLESVMLTEMVASNLSQD